MKTILIFNLFLSLCVYASTITMEEHDIALNTGSLEALIVLDENVYLRTTPLPCPFYPKGIYGDLYECATTKQELATLLNNKNIFTYTPSELQNYLLTVDFQFTCNTTKVPEKIKYQDRNVYHFKGFLKSVL